MRSQHPTDVLERENEALRRFLDQREFIRALRWAREKGKALSTWEQEILALADKEEQTCGECKWYNHTPAWGSRCSEGMIYRDVDPCQPACKKFAYEDK